jgi:translation initiation factor 3 subunit A
MLMRLQVEQLEKEKKELHERLRIIAKRVDHIERAYRKEERPLLAQDYHQQQVADRETFEEIQRAHIESARHNHKQEVETKRRLVRILPDYAGYKEVVLEKRREQFARRKAAAEKRVAEEKAKKRAVIVEAREAARKQHEEEERLRREEEEEEARLAAGTFLLSFPFFSLS